MSAPEYYIVVKKDKNGTFTIEDSFPQTQSTTDERAPTAIITNPNTTEIYFPIKVKKTTSSGSTPPNSFDVNGITYTLILDTAIKPDINDKNLIINENNFATFTTSPAVQPGNNNNNNSASGGTGQSAGGNKQKQRRSKRNYSKKQRKQWAKNNTLRNYFNYNESAP